MPSLVDRAKNICLTPNTEWPVIAAEATTAALSRLDLAKLESMKNVGVQK